MYTKKSHIKAFKLHEPIPRSKGVAHNIMGKYCACYYYDTHYHDVSVYSKYYSEGIVEIVRYLIYPYSVCIFSFRSKYSPR